MEEFSIQVNDLTKTFGSFIAVNHVSFNVRQGSIFGFLGSNGAGKSTCIRMLCGLLQSSKGTAKVAGYDINKEAELVKSHIGYMSQKFSLYDDLKVRENMVFFGNAYGITGKALNKRIDHVLELVNLKELENKMTRDLPGGWKQRIALGTSILHSPKVVFLDEPTGGVDPINRRIFWDLIHELSGQGVTVFVTTHYLDEAEYCENICLIDAGTIIANGSPKDLKKEVITTPLFELQSSDSYEASGEMKNEQWVKNVSLFGRLIHVNVQESSYDEAFIRHYFKEKGFSLERIEVITPSLEDVFLEVIEKSQSKRVMA